MRKKLLSALLALSLLFTLLPTSVMAAEVCDVRVAGTGVDLPASAGESVSGSGYTITNNGSNSYTMVLNGLNISAPSNQQGLVISGGSWTIELKNTNTISAGSDGLYLNGAEATISGSGSLSVSGKRGIVVYKEIDDNSSSSLTIAGGTVNAVSNISSDAAIFVTSNSSLKITGGTVTAKSENGSAGIDISHYCSAAITGGTVTASGSPGIHVQSGSNLTLSGSGANLSGTDFTGSNSYGVQVTSGGTVNIRSGHLTSNGRMLIDDTSATSADTTISSVTVGQSGQLTANQDVGIDGSLTNAGTFTLNGKGAGSGTLSNTGTIEGMGSLSDNFKLPLTITGTDCSVKFSRSIDVAPYFTIPDGAGKVVYKGYTGYKTSTQHFFPMSGSMLQVSETGTYTVEANTAAGNFYKAGKGILTITLTNTDVSGVTVTPYSGTYDGNAHNAVKVTGIPAGLTASYAETADGVYSTSCPQVKNVADSGKTFFVRVSGPNYNTWTSQASAPVSITPKALTCIGITAQKAYDGSTSIAFGELSLPSMPLSGVCAGDETALSLTAPQNAAFRTAAAGQNKPFSFSAALTGTAAANYTLAADACRGTGTVSAHPITDASVSLSIPEGGCIYNGSAAFPGVTVTLDGKALNSSLYSVSYRDAQGNTVNAPTAAGTYTVAVTANSGNYSGTAASRPTFTIEQAAPALTWASASQALTYTGGEAAINAPNVTLANGGSFSGSISYSYRAAGAAEDTSGLPIDAGAYTVTAHVLAGGNYKAADSSPMELTIMKSSPMVALNGYSPAKTYDGAPLQLPAASELALTGAAYRDVKFTWYQNSVSAANKLSAAPVNAGSYLLVAEISETANTSSASVASGVFVISKAGLTITAKAQTIIFGGKIAADTAQVTAAGLAGGESLTGITLTASGTEVTSSGKIAPSAAVISGNGAGNYTIQYADGNLTITKANPAHIVPANLTAVYGQTLADITLPTAENGVWSWNDSSISVGNVGSNTFAATFTPNDTTNYNTLGNISVSVAVSQATPVIGAVSYTGSTLYDTTAVENISLTRADLTVPGSLTLDGVSALTAGTNSYQWKFVPTDSTNYKSISGTLDLTVSADALDSISIGSTAPQKTAYTYGESFAVAGLTVTAVYQSGNTANVTGKVTAGTLHGGDTSVVLTYTEGAAAKTCTVSGLTVRKQAISVSGMSWGSDSFTYDGSAHGLYLNGILPAGVTVTETDDEAIAAGSYTASASFALAAGYDAGDYEIIGANPLTKGWSISTAAVPGAKNLGAALRYTNTKTQTLTAADFGITMKGSFTANGAVTDSGSVLSAAPTYGKSVQYALRSGLSFSGQTVTIPVTFTPNDTNYAPIHLSAVITLTDKNTVTLTLAASKSKDVAYGDSVTYTAALDKEHAFLNALDKLDGEIEFYLGNPSSGGTLLGTKTISGSGGTASITLDFDKLTAGDHTITAVYGGNADFANASTDAVTAVAKKVLAWDVSGLWAAKRADGRTTAEVNGKLLVGGALEGTDPGFSYSTMAGEYDGAAAGKHTVTVTVMEGLLSNGNYALPSGAPHFTGMITAVSELPGAPSASGGITYRLEQENGISAVPDALKANEKLNTPAKITAQMRVSVTDQSSGISSANIEVYDVALQFSLDGGKTWTTATEANFPAGGITILLPYPPGTGRTSHDFVVTHMFTTGDKAGTTENVSFEKTADGLKFTLYSLSPVAVGYKAASMTGGTAGQTFTITTSAGAGGSFDTAQVVTVKIGESAGFSIKPNAGYAVADVKVDGKSVGAVNYYAFSNITSNHTISATFKKALHKNPQTGVG